MKKYFFLIIAFFAITSFSSAQKVFFTKSGQIDFFSKTPMENIEAKNKQAVGFLKTEKGIISFGLLIKSFKFKNALMEEHFNENYAESDKYPKAKFKGKIINLSDVNFNQDGSYDAKVKGKLTFHGITQEIIVNATLIVSSENIKATSTFKLKPVDFNIEIPNIVRDKIAKEITVNVNINYKIYNK